MMACRQMRGYLLSPEVRVADAVSGGRYHELRSLLLPLLVPVAVQRSFPTVVVSRSGHTGGGKRQGLASLYESSLFRPRSCLLEFDPRTSSFRLDARELLLVAADAHPASSACLLPRHRRPAGAHECCDVDSAPRRPLAGQRPPFCLLLADGRGNAKDFRPCQLVEQYAAWLLASRLGLSLDSFWQATRDWI